MHKQDWINDWRRRVKPHLHGLFSSLGLYSELSSSEESYACTVNLSKDELEKELERIGFLRNPVAAMKYRMVDSRKQYSRGSWFYFTMEDPVSIAGVDFPRYQYHVTLYNHPERDGVDCYIHKEYWWGTNPEGHVEGEDKSYNPDWLRSRFSAEGIDYEIRDIEYA